MVEPDAHVPPAATALARLESMRRAAAAAAAGPTAIIVVVVVASTRAAAVAAWSRAEAARRRVTLEDDRLLATPAVIHYTHLYALGSGARACAFNSSPHESFNYLYHTSIMLFTIELRTTLPGT